MKIKNLTSVCVICVIILFSGCQSSDDNFIDKNILESLMLADPSTFLKPDCPKLDPEDEDVIPQFPCHEDRSYYWVCRYYLDERYAELCQCPPGLHYNPVLYVCDYPENVGRNGR